MVAREAREYVTKSLNISQRRFFKMKFDRANTKLTQKEFVGFEWRVRNQALFYIVIFFFAPLITYHAVLVL